MTFQFCKFNIYIKIIKIFNPYGVGMWIFTTVANLYNLKASITTNKQVPTSQQLTPLLFFIISSLFSIKILTSKSITINSIEIFVGRISVAIEIIASSIAS